MTLDDTELDLHARAVEAASVVLRRYWPEGTAPPDPERLAARMGIEVVPGQPAGNAAVTAVRDERSARVVLSASLHPSLRSDLLLRAIGHLSRPGTPATSSDGVTDEFTRSFAWALRIPEHALQLMRRQGLSWQEIDDRLGVDRDKAQEQSGVYAQVWRWHQRTSFGRLPSSRGVTPYVDLGSTWQSPLPRDSITDALHGLAGELTLSGLATVRRHSPVSGYGPDGREGDPGGVTVSPAAVAGAPQFWWSQTPDQIRVGVGSSDGWVLARDGRGVAAVRQLADAVLFGRVEVRRGERVWTYRVWLTDGTVLDDSGRQPAGDGFDHHRRPIPWEWAPAYIQRRQLLQAVADAVTRVIDRTGRMRPPGHPIEIDAELSSGVQAYLSRPLYHPEGVAAVAVHRTPAQLLGEIELLLGEMNRVPLAEARGSFSTEIDLVSAHLDAHHPELTREARSTLVNRWAFAHR